MSWFDIIKQLTPMQSRLKDIARREGIEKFGDRTMIIRINKKMGDDFELTLRSKTTGEDRRSVYQFKFRNGELYMAEGPHLVYTASMGRQGDGEEELYRAFKQSINELMETYRAKNPQPVVKPVQYTGETGGRRFVNRKGRPTQRKLGVGFVNRKIDNSANQKENQEYRRRMKEIYGYDEDDLQ